MNYTIGVDLGGRYYRISGFNNNENIINIKLIRNLLNHKNTPYNLINLIVQ